MSKLRIRTAIDLLSGKCTLKQALYQVQMRLFNAQRHLRDDFDWTKYHGHYREELRVMERCFTLLLQAGAYTVNGTKIHLRAGLKPLHPNHHLLYETVLALSPSSALEVGCGGGDHLRNIKFIAPRIDMFGVDRSESQLRNLRTRHPHLNAKTYVADVTDGTLQMEMAELVYSQAVLMHISEAGGRHLNALRNMFKGARSHIVLMENWTRHEFLKDCRSVVQDPKLGWQGAHFYYTYRENEPRSRAMIISKCPLDYARLDDYDDLLQGGTMELNSK